MPLFQRYYDDYRDADLVVLGVNQGESLDVVQTFIQETGITYPILLDTETKTAAAYQVIALPVTIFIDQEGIIRYQHIGVISEAQFTNYLKALGVIQ